MARITRSEYQRIHNWLLANFEKEACENFDCDKTSSRLEWALIAGKTHAKVRENYMVLCKPCHARYDQKHKNIGHIETDERKNLKLLPHIFEKLKMSAARNRRTMVGELAWLLDRDENVHNDVPRQSSMREW